MSEYIKNTTGKMPVAKGTNVDVIFADGSKAWNVPAGIAISKEDALARNPDNTGYAQDWSLDGGPSDIVEWRLTE